MPSHQLMWPVLLYVGAALLIPRLRPWLDRPGRTFAVLLASVLGFGAILWITSQAGGEAARWTLSDWDGLAGLGGGIRLRLDTLSVSFLLLLSFTSMGTLVGSLDDPEQSATDDYQSGLLALLGGLSLFALADNLLTLLLAGFLLDLTLVFAVGLSGRPRWFLIMFMQSLVSQGLLLAAALTVWRDTGATSISDASTPAYLLFVLAAATRMAPLPFSLIPVAFEKLPQRVLALLPLSTLGVGGLLLARAAETASNAIPDLAVLGPMAALSVALAGWVAWRREEHSIRLMMLSAVQAAWALWAFAWGLPASATAIAWGGSAALAALAVHGGRMDFRRGSQLAGLLASLMLIGVPGSALWQGLSTLGGEAWQQGSASTIPQDAAGWALPLAIIGLMGTVVALFYWSIPEQSEPRQPSRWTGVALLALLSVPAISALFGIRVPPLAAEPISDSPLAARLVVPIVGWAGGFLLWRLRGRLQSLRPLLERITEFFSFVWLWRIIGRVGWLLMSGLRGILLILEGENYGWLLLFLFVTMIFLLRQQGAP